MILVLLRVFVLTIQHNNYWYFNMQGDLLYRFI